MVKGTRGSAKVGLLTLIPEEYKAVRQAFGLDAQVSGTNYSIAAPSSSEEYDVVATRSDQWGSVRAGQILRTLLEDFRPPYVLVVGIAGGILNPFEKNPISVGDVVIPDYVSYAEVKKLISGKVERPLIPYDQPSHYLRRHFAEPLCDLHPEKWIGQLKPPPTGSCTSRARIGHLVAGETLLGDDRSRIQQRVLRDFPTAIAVDMESYGIASEMFNSRVSVTYNPQYLVIRGISDLVRPKPKKGSPPPPLSNQEERNRWREYSAHCAAVFAKVLVSDLLSAASLPTGPDNLSDTAGKA